MLAIQEEEHPRIVDDARKMNGGKGDGAMLE
jgi:hypothetical protein